MSHKVDKMCEGKDGGKIVIGPVKKFKRPSYQTLYERKRMAKILDKEMRSENLRQVQADAGRSRGDKR